MHSRHYFAYVGRKFSFGFKVEMETRKRHPSPIMEPKDEPLLVTVKDAMRLLHRGRARVYEMCATGELESIRDGRSILIPRDALVQWISQKRQKGRSHSSRR